MSSQDQRDQTDTQPDADRPAEPETLVVHDSIDVVPQVARVEAASSERAGAQPAPVAGPLGAAPAFASAPVDRLHSWVGYACLLGGSCALVAAIVAPSVVQPLETFGSPKAIAGALALAGFVLLGLGRVRRALAGVGSTLELVHAKTQRIDAVAREGEDLRREVAAVAELTSVLQGEMATIQRRLDELTKLAANPEIQTSMFHLAASQDQLAKRVDLAMTERFRTLHKDLAGTFESISLMQQGFAQELRAFAAAWDQRLDVHQDHLRHSLQALQAEGAEQRARLERIVVGLDCVTQDLSRQREALVSGLGLASEASDRAAKETNAALEVLREQVDSRLQMHVLALDDHLEQVRAGVERRVTDVANAQAQAFQELATRGRAEGSEQVRGLEHRLDALAEGLQRTQQELASSVDGLAGRLEQRLGEESGGLLAQLQAQARAASETRVELGLALEALRDQTTQAIASLAGDHAAGRGELVQRWEHERRQLDARLVALDEATRAVRSEFAAFADEHAQRLGSELREKLDELRAGIETFVNRVERGLERVDGAQGSRHGEVIDHAQRAHAALVEGMEQLAAHVEHTLAMHVESLRERLQAAARSTEDVSARVQSGLAELGERLAQGVTRIDDAQSTVLGEIAGQLTADRVRGERSLQEGLRSIETSTQRASQELARQLEGLAPALADEVRSRLDDLQANLLDASRVAEDAAERLRAGVDDLGHRIEAQLRTRHEALAQDLIALAELAHETPGEARELLGSAGDPPALEPSAFACPPQALDGGPAPVIGSLADTPAPLPRASLAEWDSSATCAPHSEAHADYLPSDSAADPLDARSDEPHGNGKASGD